MTTPANKTRIQPMIDADLYVRMIGHVGVKPRAISAFIESAITEKLDLADMMQGQDAPLVPFTILDAG